MSSPRDVLEEEGVDFSSMPDETLHLFCKTCGSWYNDTTAKSERSMLVRVKGSVLGVVSVHYCSCHGRVTELMDGAEWNARNPSEEWMLSKLNELEDSYELKLRQIAKAKKGL